MSSINIKDPGARLLPSGRTLHIETLNLTSFQTIIFIHGLGASSSTFGSIIESSGIADDFNIITYDQEGFGLSSKTSQGEITIDKYVEDVRDILISSGVERAGVVAHSMGGVRTAQHFRRMGSFVG